MVFLCFVVSLVSAAHASFTLGLVGDNAGRCIHRYDLDSGAYLGKFGNFALGNVFGMGLDQARNKLYVGDAGMVKAFDYNTGSYLYSLPASNAVGISTFSNGDLLLSNGTIVTRVDATTGATINSFNYAAGGLQGSAASVAVDESDRVFVCDSAIGATANNAKIDVFSGNGTYLFSSAAYTQRFAFYYQQMQARGGRLIMGNDSLGNYHFFTYGSTSIAYGGTPGALSPMQQILGVGFGHGSLRYLSGTDSSTNPILQVTDAYNVFQTIPTPQISLGGMRQLAIVVAPEPTSFAALALGLGFLARARKK